MSSTKRVVVISADGHAGAPISAYREYVEPRFRADLDALISADEQWRATAISQRRFGAAVLDLIDRDGAIRAGGEFGAWELDRRLAELDREGVAAEVLIPGHQLAVLPWFGIMNDPTPAELRAAGARAYHRHLADGMADADGRLVAIADPGPCHDMQETIAELRWVAAHGFVGVAAPGAIDDPTLPPLTSPYFEPFWAACAELGLVLNIHAGWGMGQLGDFSAAMPEAIRNLPAEDKLAMQMTADVSIDQFPKDSPLRLAITRPRRPLWQLMLAGVFDRYPGLKLVFTEIRADWVPAALDVLDRTLAGERLARTPSQIWAEQCYVAPSSPRPYELALRDTIGTDRLMFGMDYPHPEGTWPNTREWLRETLRGVSEDDARRFLGSNAVECYGLDGAHLERVAERIGPRAQDVLTGAEVDDALLAQFHARSGFRRPAERVDADFYAEMIDADRREAAGFAVR